MKRPEWKKIGSCVVTAVFVVLLVAVGVLQKTARTEVDVILFAGQSTMNFGPSPIPRAFTRWRSPLEKMRTIPVCVTTGDCWNEPVPWCLRL